MTTRLLWRRAVQVSVAGLVIRAPLRISFRLRQDAALATPSGGAVELHNLSTHHEAQIADRGGEIVVEAGYGGDLGPIFDGVVERVERERSRLARRTRLEVVGRAVSRVREGGVSIRTFAAGTPLATVVGDLIADLNLDAGDLGALADDALAGPWSWDSTSVEALEALLRPRGLRAYEAAGVLHVDREGRLHPDALPLRISASTGMVSTPVIADAARGVRVSTLLDHRAQIGARVELTTSNAAAAGAWKVAAVAHAGTTAPTGTFRTTLELRALS